MFQGRLRRKNGSGRTEELASPIMPSPRVASLKSAGPSQRLVFVTGCDELSVEQPATLVTTADIIKNRIAVADMLDPIMAFPLIAYQNHSRAASDSSRWHSDRRNQAPSTILTARPPGNNQWPGNSQLEPIPLACRPKPRDLGMRTGARPDCPPPPTSLLRRI